jgi:excisionase family DNA binding protein
MAQNEKCPPTKPLNNHMWMTSDEAAELLRISRKALYHRVRREQIRVHRLGRCYRFHRREIEAALLLSKSFAEN